MTRWIIGIIAVLLLAQGCNIQKRQYRDGWYIDRHHDSWESPAPDQNFNSVPVCPDTTFPSQVVSNEVAVDDSLAEPTDTASQKISPVFSVPPGLGPEPLMSYEEAKARLQAKNLKMDPVLKFGYFASFALMILTTALWPLSLALLIIARVKIRRYSTSGEPGAQENQAVAEHIVKHVLLGFLIAAIAWIALIGFMVYVAVLVSP